MSLESFSPLSLVVRTIDVNSNARIPVCRAAVAEYFPAAVEVYLKNNAKGDFFCEMTDDPADDAIELGLSAFSLEKDNVVIVYTNDKTLATPVFSETFEFLKAHISAGRSFFRIWFCPK